jgi:CshA-type fibril repeat protein/VCBS repeat-containing protein
MRKFLSYSIFTALLVGGLFAFATPATVTHAQQVCEPLYRVNAGGPEIAALDGSIAWAEDQAASGARAAGSAQAGTPSPYHNMVNVNDRTYGANATMTINGTVDAAAVPTTLFNTERWDRPQNPAMIWTFPVTETGDYLVNLYFAEIFQQQPGLRVFDINVEGQTVAEAFDPYVEAGNARYVGMRLPVSANITDGDIQIETVHDVENPKISAIEIYSACAFNVAPTATDDSANTTHVQPITFDVIGNDSDSDGTLDPTSIDLDPATTGQQAALTLDGEGEYAANNDGTVTFTPNPAFVGTSTATYTVADDFGFPSNVATIGVTVTEATTDCPAIYRVNAGGPETVALDDGIAWAEDQASANARAGGTAESGTPSPYHNMVNANDRTYGVNATMTINETVDAAVVPTTLFNTERWDRPQNPVMTWTFPVDDAGDYLVNLYFNEIYHQSANKRVFGIEVEGETIFEAFDPYVEAGNARWVGMRLPALVNVTDGDVQIETVHDVENPKISAIEIVPLDCNEAPVAVDDNATTTQDQPVSFNITDNDTDADGTVDITTVDLDPATAGQQTAATIAGEGEYVYNNDGTVTFTPERIFLGTSTMTYTVADDLGKPSETATITVEVTDIPVLCPAVYRVNAGGPEIAALDAGPVWSPDVRNSNPSPYVNDTENGNRTYSTNATITLDASVDSAVIPSDLFKTERWDPPAAAEMLWTFPDLNTGDYVVNLYFAEIANQGEDERIFDVEVEGELVLDDYQVYLDADSTFNHGLRVAIPVTITDTDIQIEFLHVVENPKINALEIYKLDCNEPPVVDTNDGLTLPEGATATITQAMLEATDADNDPLTYTVSTLPVNGDLLVDGVAVVANGTFTQGQINVGDLSYAHDGGETTADSFAFTVSDGEETTGSTTFDITITPDNDAPQIITNNTLSVAEGDTGTITDTLLQADDVDDDNDTLIYTVTTIPVNGELQVSGATVTLNGTFTQAQLNANTVVYAHDGSETNADSFVFTVSDGDATTTAATFNINVTPVNDAPQLVANNTLTVAEGATDTVAQALLEHTDDDDSAAELTYTVTALPMNGELRIGGATAVLNAVFTQAQVNANAVTYVHDGSETTADSFDFSLSDNVAPALTGTFDITITPENDTPQIVTNSVLTVAEGDAGIIAGTLLQADDADADNDTLIYTVTTLPANGELQVSGAALTLNGTFTQAQLNADAVTYIHDGSETTADSFVFTVSDNVEATAPATFNITVTPVNDAPQLIANAPLTVTEGGNGTITTLLLQHTDSDSAPLTYTVTALPINGELRVNGTALAQNETFTQAQIDANAVTYAHNGSETTADSFDFSLSDGTAPALTDTFIINITSDNDLPTLTSNNPLTVAEGDAGTINTVLLQYDDIDGDNDALIYTVTALPTNGELQVSGATVALNGTFTQAQINADAVTYTHDGTETTADSFIFNVTDDGGLTTTPATFNIIITPENDAPRIVTNNALTVAEGDTATIGTALLQSSDDDNSAGELTYTVTALPANGTLQVGGATVALNGTFTQAQIDADTVAYVHNGSETATDAFTFTVNDGTATTDPATFVINVTPVSDAPTVTTNNTLELQVGDTATITNALLAAEDIDDDNTGLQYNISIVPTVGNILVNGAASNTFTQAQIDGGQVAYQHTGMTIGTDNFVFTVTDGTTPTAATTFNITIFNPTDTVPFDLYVTGDLGNYPLDLTYHWTHRINVDDTEVPADWYNVLITQNGMTVVDEWIEAVNACMEVECSLNYLDKVPPYVFDAGVYDWHVSGWTEATPGQWQSVTSGTANFEVTVNAIQPVSNVQVTPNQGRPTIAWDNDPAATWFQIYLGNSQTEVFFDWVEKSAVMCDGTRCNFMPDVNPLPGTYDVWMRAWGPSGFSGGGIDGWQGPASVTIADVAPAAVSTGFNTIENGDGTVSISWDGPAYATWYNIWVGHQIGGEYATDHYEWHVASDLNCANAGVCTLTLTLPDGNYEWVLRAWGPGGYNEDDGQVWSPLQAFTVGVGVTSIELDEDIGDVVAPEIPEIND